MIHNMRRKIHNFWCIPIYLIALSLYIALINFTENEKNTENYLFIGKNFKYLVNSLEIADKNFLSLLPNILICLTVFSIVYTAKFILFMKITHKYFMFTPFIISTMDIIFFLFDIYYRCKFTEIEVLYWAYKLLTITYIFIYFYFVCRKINKYIIELLKISTKIQKSFFITIFFSSIIRAICTLGIIMDFLYIFIKNETVFIYSILFAMVIFLWSLSIINYIQQVFISSIVSYKLLLDEISNFKIVTLSLINTIKTMGSVFYGSFYVALSTLLMPIYLFFYIILWLNIPLISDIIINVFFIPLYIIDIKSTLVLYSSLIYIAIYGCSLKRVTMDEKLHISNLNIAKLFKFSIFDVVMTINLANLSMNIVDIYHNYLTYLYIYSHQTEFIVVSLDIGTLFGVILCFSLFQSISFGYRTILALHEAKRKYMEEKIPILKDIRIADSIF